MEPRSSRLALTFIFITMLVDPIGLGIIILVSPRLIAPLTHQGMNGAARWGGMLMSWARDRAHARNSRLGA